jgi:hypothetical protein
VSGTCKRPDRHNSKLVCGYPLPCPHHTHVIELAEGKVVLAPDRQSLTPEQRRHLDKIAQALKPDEET